MDKPLPPRLYHGTSIRHVESILKHGIKPRGAKKSVDKNWPSHPKRVYLSDAFAFKFALDAKRDKDSGIAIFEVDTTLLQPWLFAADDDVVAEKLAKIDGIPFEQAVKKAAKVAHNYCPAHSLDLGGSCSFEGTIPPSAITRYLTVDYEAQKWFLIGAWDVGTGQMAYRITKPRHAARLAWAFGDPEPADLPDVAKNFGFDPVTNAFAFKPWSETRDGIEVINRKEVVHV